MRITCSVIFFISLISSIPVYSCDCQGESTVKGGLESSDIVLVGKIISKQVVRIIDSTIHEILPNDTLWKSLPPYQTKFTRFELLVRDFYKGKISKDTVSILTGLSGRDCGIRFKIGENYIVYGNKDSYFRGVIKEINFRFAENVYWTNSCTRTMLFYQSEIDEIEKYAKKKTRNEQDEDSLIFVDPDILPHFKNGGEPGLRKFIKDSLRYPETIGYVQGRVIVEFIVDTLGNVKDAKVVKGLSPELNEEALRVIKMLTFIPGSRNGKAIETKMAIPIKFKRE